MLLKPSNKLKILTSGSYSDYRVMGLIKINRECNLIEDICSEVGEKSLLSLIENGSITVIECDEIDYSDESITDGNSQIKYYQEWAKDDET